MADGSRDDVSRYRERKSETQDPAQHHQDQFEPVERPPFQVMLSLQHQFVGDGHASASPSSQIKLASSRRPPGPITLVFTDCKRWLPDRPTDKLRRMGPGVRRD